MSEKPLPPSRSAFPHLLAIPTRWMDQDPYGHVNNVQYYAYFDTVVNRQLILEAGLDVVESPFIGLVVESKCQFLREISFPQTVYAGMRVTKIGRSSIIYEIGLFRDNEEDCAAIGHFVHVYVDRESREPVPVPEPVRAAIAPLQVQ